jgi:hypothetical protein
MVNRRGFLKAIAATAIAVPLAPLIPKYATGGTITPERAARVLGVPPAVLGVRKLSYYLPVTKETLEDLAVWGTTFKWDGERVDPRLVLPA